MKDIRIGNLVFNKKAILMIAFCLFLNGMFIGALAAMNIRITGMLFLAFFAFMFLPYVAFYKSIMGNIREVEDVPH